MNAPVEPAALATPVAVRRLSGMLPPEGGEAGIRAILDAGAQHVFIGEDALLDGALVEKLVAEYGSGRIGVYVPARRMQASWSMDIDSNADFRVMTPSVCEPCWEILRADGSGSGTHAAWWIGEMFGLGASGALIRVDIEDDADLNILAGLTERWGDRLWLAPLNEANPDLEAWVGLGRASRLAVPDAIYQNSPYLKALRSAPETGKSNEGIG
ncbi:MAG: hypothetical protein HZC23_07150 [Rhodocyclales bacterium]|nr:hypothetical protein [Rhodocyclales bacterium]